MTTQIRGGIGPSEAAAVIAVVSRVLEEEALASTRPPIRNLLPAWVRSGHARPLGRFTLPLDPDDLRAGQ